MINALPTAITVRFLTVLVVLMCGAVVALSSPSQAGRLVATQGFIVLAMNAVVFLLTIPPIFRWFHKVTKAHLWWFPLLDGEWEATVWSNWPRIDATLSAARGATPPFDPLTQDPPSGVGQPITMNAEIKSSLFGIEIVMTVEGTKRRSRTVFVRPQWCRPSLPMMTYVYKQDDHEPISVTDVQEHFGAGVLEYDPKSDELRGQYWTQRQGGKGLNTAGILVLNRVAP